jgi:hypothetical protein
MEITLRQTNPGKQTRKGFRIQSDPLIFRRHALQRKNGQMEPSEYGSLSP